MGASTGIAWCDATWNCWQGCTKVSSGCSHCYMYREKKQYGQDPSVVVRSKPATFNAPLKWKPGKRVFVCSWSDFFHSAADAWRAEAWAIIQQRPDLTFLILTKRIERVAMWPILWPSNNVTTWSNVWLGVSVEDQATADARIPLLLQTPAAKRFVSYEPAIGPVNFECFPSTGCPTGWLEDEAGIDWIICGAESGPRARPMHPDWARSVRDQCQAAAVPFFFKQGPGDIGRFVKMPLLDGQEWREVPC